MDHARVKLPNEEPGPSVLGAPGTHSASALRRSHPQHRVRPLCRSIREGTSRKCLCSAVQLETLRALVHVRVAGLEGHEVPGAGCPPAGGVALLFMSVCGL